MPLRYDQRQHIIRSLDNFVYQLITLSFLLSPSFLPYAFRILFQFQFSRPRELDPKRSLRFWYFLVIVFHGTGLWSHAMGGATHGRAIILDFIGPLSQPSKLRLILLDSAIIILNLVLTTIAYETALQTEMPDETPDPLLPAPPIYFSSPTMFTNPDQSHTESPYVLDLRLGQVINRLRSLPPQPPERPSSQDLLPLPITTPWRLSLQLQALMRARARVRERNRPRNETVTQEPGEGSSSPSESRTVPGGLDSDVT